MNFDLTEEQRLIQETARDFATAELEVAAAELDRGGDEAIFLGNLKKLAELGFMGLNIQETYGGCEAGPVALSLALTELGRACASTAETVSVNNMVCEVIQTLGTEEQKTKYIGRICSGEFAAGSFALTEPGAGSDPAGMTTVAIRDGNEWVLNGTKIFISNTTFAGIFVVWAVTDQKAPKGKGISLFLVEAGTKGLIIGRKEKKMGQHASPTTELILQDVRVPKENMLGKNGGGFRVAMESLNSGRISVGASALGMGARALELALKYARERKQFGEPIASFQLIQNHLANMHCRLESARWIVYNAAWRKDQGLDYATEAATAKLVASEMATYVAHRAIQILGGYGYLREYEVERLYREARLTELFEGTSEIQRLVIARGLIKRG